MTAAGRRLGFRAIAEIWTSLVNMRRERLAARVASATGVRLVPTERTNTSHDELVWSLQVRAPVRLRSGREGVTFAVATAHMRRADLEWLREQIDIEIGSRAVQCACGQRLEVHVVTDQCLNCGNVP